MEQVWWVAGMGEGKVKEMGGLTWYLTGCLINMGHGFRL